MHVNGKFTDIYSYVKNILFLMALLTIGGTKVWGQSIEVTTDTSNPVYYLFQSFGNTSFYMRPNGTNVSTLNILTDDMKWYFLESDETGYYYICDKDGRYLYFSRPYGSANDRTWMALKNNLDNNDKAHYKFSIAKNNTKGWDAYNIIPYGNGDKYCLNKQGRNAGDNGVQVTNGYDDENSNWVFIPMSDYTWTLRSDCFRPSDSSNKYYYQIKIRRNANYFIKPGATYVETSNTVDDDMVWYFEEAASDAFMKYYYIKHANTGQHLRYRSTAEGQDNAIELANHTGSETGDEEARFQFIVVRGAVTNEPWNSKDIFYNIVPKLLKSTSSDNSIKSVSYDKGLGNPLKTKKHRNSDDTQWSFMSVNYSTICAKPTITFSNTTGKATITTLTTRSTIYYTTDGTEPSSSNGTAYNDTPFDVTEQTTIKAIVTRPGFTDSEVATTTIYKVATPTIQDNGNNTISITCGTSGATIYYTTDGNTPTTSSTQYTAPLGWEYSGATIKAIAVKNGSINSMVATGSVTLKCAKPVFTVTKSGDARTLSISCAFPPGATIYYTKNGSTPTSSSTPYSGAMSVVIGDVIRAIGTADGLTSSDVAIKTIREELTPTYGKYLINNQDEFDTFIDMASSDEGGATYHYLLNADVNAGSEITIPFSGTFDGQGHTISGLDHALFNSIDGGTVKDVILDGVNITSGTNVGAIANETSGASRIYNIGILGGSVGGSNNVGGIVGLLDGTSRVVNCYSYATITGGNDVGGIVGYNNGTTTAGNINTMVMNCMFYGDITGGTTVSPVYGGNIINNLPNASNRILDGLNTFNYYAYEKLKTTAISEGKYNCAQAVEDVYLNRFEFYRQLLNSNRRLAAYYITGNVTDASIMKKWVLETADRTITNPKPYPVLKDQDK